ncbi:DUF3805 domain-containing protein [Bacteroides coprosuis]|uniref:DUF3805 domain-containing protein n=1 Tax=Bacteroides coprosuis TaxID=151276 RepID=UPI001E0CBEBD|nr:DUF3805 domain-containing protein [Bacteroides coprosuis]HJD92849.1 DUF3805 domain-containing protein [Bacteroides coprosuis]
MKETKKFISPNAWFSIEYPANWYEFEDGEGSFLFYNPDQWTGNFRISGLKGDSSQFGAQVVKEEREVNLKVKPFQLSSGEAVYEVSFFQEDEHEFASHHWVIGKEDMSFDCTFTSFKKDGYKIAEEILNTLVVRDTKQKYPAEIIPVRLMEIYEINSSYEWVVNFVKEQLTTDFQGIEEDLSKLDKIKEEGSISTKKRDKWVALGLTVGVILANEIEGMEWRTLIDGNREAAILIYTPSQQVIDPMKLVWSKVKAGEEFTIVESYKETLASLHQ